MTPQLESTVGSDGTMSLVPRIARTLRSLCNVHFAAVLHAPDSGVNDLLRKGFECDPACLVPFALSRSARLTPIHVSYLFDCHQSRHGA
eukprot:10147886-Lingulodinium_polyedra.AAC.1